MLIDESGLLMAPLVRRSWAERGRTPVLRQKARRREKVSVAGALWVPRRGGLRLSYRTIVDGYFGSAQVAEFVAGLLDEAGRRPLVVVWDGGAMHKGDPVRRLLARRGGRLRLERLPPYAPMLNPVEDLWSWLKYSRLCNYAPRDARDLNGRITEVLDPIREDQGLLRSFWQHCELPDPLTLLS